MPIVKFKHVVTFSSEDPNHPAENLLSQDTYRKWLCATAGMKQAVVVLELEKSSQIHSIDIGNNGSAFIEVLVGRSSGSDYQVLVVASSFMSPADSKSWTNTNRVRMFGKEKLSKVVSEQKWDTIKVVCTQPFNKNEKYGLSFITLHSPPDKKDAPVTPLTDAAAVSTGSSTRTLGAFALKEDVPVLPTGSFFYKKDKDAKSSPSLAVEARKATAIALKEAEETEQTATNPTRSIEQKHQSKRTKVKDMPIEQKHQSSKTKVKDMPPLKKRKVDDEVPPNEFDELLKGVVFSLSGFQNPLRGSLREKGMEMGAEYEPDWGPSSTHLVCAFESTPKFKQVKAKKGLVVRKEWLMDCHRMKKRLPASKYRFSTGSNSEDEIDFYDTKETDLFRNVTYASKLQRKKLAAVSSKKNEDDATNDKGATCNEGQLKVGKTEGVEEDDPYGGSTDEEMDTTVKCLQVHKEGENSHYQENTDNCDTEDEIERVKCSGEVGGDSGTGKVVANEEISGIQEGNVSKDEKIRSLLDLPDFFAGCVFFLYGSFEASDTKLIRRYITAYNGQIENYMSDSVTHVVSMDTWDDNFDQALSDNSSLIFVKPEWIFKCHSKQSLVPYQPFAIVPS